MRNSDSRKQGEDTVLKLATSAIALLFAMIQSTNAQKIEKKDYSALGIYEFFLDQQHPEWLQQIR